MISREKVYGIFRSLAISSFLGAASFLFFSWRIYQGYSIECSHHLISYCNNYIIPIFFSLFLFFLSMVFGLISLRVK